jgi:hypothetical protein
MISLTMNGEFVRIDAPDDTLLLWVLRDVLNLTGTKFGYRIAQCGACTVRVIGQSRRSCVARLGRDDHRRSGPNGRRREVISSSPSGVEQGPSSAMRDVLALVIALLSTFDHANGSSTGRIEALHECNVTAQKRWSGKYDFERNQRAVYAACMFSHGQPQ